MLLQTGQPFAARLTRFSERKLPFQVSMCESRKAGGVGGGQVVRASSDASGPLRETTGSFRCCRNVYARAKPAPCDLSSRAKQCCRSLVDEKQLCACLTTAPARCDTSSLQVHVSGCVGWIAPTLMDGSWQTVGGKKKDKQAEKKRKTNEAEPLKQSADGAPSAFAALDAWKRDGELPLQRSRRNMIIKPQCTEFFSTLTADMK